MLDSFDGTDPATISFASEPLALPERRQASRHVTVMRVAKLHTPHGQEFCLVRNISAGGLMAHIYSELLIGDPVVVEFRSGQTIAAKVLWRREGAAGLRFDVDIDAAAVLAGRVDSIARPLPARAPRVWVEAEGRIRSGQLHRHVTLCDISQGGARIRMVGPEAIEEKIVLMVTGLSPITGEVRWRDADHAGIAFDTPIPFDTLARWVPAIQRRVTG